ncbi:4336_t:CDS:2 [Rhizophagus irregularis]|nr:4336_t:CDS:2 [Rhizophagus irregularis]
MSLDTATSSLFPQPVPQPVLVSRHSQPADNIPKKLKYSSPTIKSAIGSAGGALACLMVFVTYQNN